jgi:uncharacterized protein YndB with AHSA1/START domain
MHGSYVTDDGRPALRFDRRLPHPVDSVWRAVTEPAELAQWFPTTVEVDLRPGGAMTFRFPDGAFPETHGEVTELDPPRRFAFSWGEELLRFELEPAEGGAACDLRFTHVLSRRDAAARDMAGWHVCLDSLAQRLGGGAAGAPATGVSDRWQALYDEYQRRGVPAGAAIPGRP